MKETNWFKNKPSKSHLRKGIKTPPKVETTITLELFRISTIAIKITDQLMTIIWKDQMERKNMEEEGLKVKVMKKMEMISLLDQSQIIL